MTRVLIVDDSSFMRQSISRVLGAQPDMEVVGAASDGIEGVALARRLRPDVVTMDVEMPRMDGLQALAILMRDAPVPVVMLSSLTAAGAPATIRALECGAVDFVQKPAPPAVGVSQTAAELVRVVRAAARARVRAINSPAVAQGLTDGGNEPPLAPRPTPARVDPRADRVLAIGCSTGGPRALLEVVPHLPANLPGAVLIVQHMPAGFTRSLAERLDRLSALEVREAADGDVPTRGLALLAPGGRHMQLDARGRVVLTDAPTVHGVRPSVDVLLKSLPAVFNGRCVTAILTGMGSDGADGAAMVRAAGGRIVAEDASTAVVYGMPKAVADRGLADRLLPLPEIAAAATDLLLSVSRAVAAT